MNIFLDAEIAGNYDLFYHTPAGKKIDSLEKQAIAGFLAQTSGKKILELGCGTGHWTQFMAELGFEVTAMDISEPMLAIARNKNISNAQFLQADATCLPLAKESFDTIVAITMLEFTNAVPQTLEEIYRVLKTGGTLILGCLNSHSELGKSKDKDATFRDAHFFSKTEFYDILKPFGKPVIRECVYLTSNFDVLDGILDEYPVEAAFLAARVKKTN